MLQLSSMVSDFFHTDVGGVENHIYMLSVTLMRMGHKVAPLFSIYCTLTISAQVIVINHSHPPDRVGIRWLSPGLKVYHIPFPTIASSATLPNFFTFLPYLRTIALRERIEIIHGHASLSSFAHESIMHAHHMGIRTVFTDHSLFGFDDAASILTNKLLEGMLNHADAAICVSHTGHVFFRQSLPPTDGSVSPVVRTPYFVANWLPESEHPPVVPVILSTKATTIPMVPRRLITRITSKQSTVSSDWTPEGSMLYQTRLWRTNSNLLLGSGLIKVRAESQATRFCINSLSHNCCAFSTGLPQGD